MARYTIPNYKLSELQKKIDKIRRKGANITFDIVTEHKAVSAPELGKHLVIDCADVDVSGEYKINGWYFVATIEHSSPENIIRLADNRFAGRIPERYRTAAPECEHCHIRRDRNDTYLVYNEDNDEWKQVGRTCLQGYTQGLNAETCADMVSIQREISRISDLTLSGNFDDQMVRELKDSGSAAMNMDVAKKKAYKYVEEHGYEAGKTGKKFIDALYDDPNLPEATEDEVNNVKAYLLNTAQSDWSRNCLAAWTKPTFEPRDAGLITSAVSGYFKYHEQEVAKQARLADASNSFAGDVGDKVRVVIKEVRVAYQRQGGNYYHAESYPVMRILGSDGKIYLWGNSQNVELQPGDILEGTIKRLNERPNGEMQTELTRCKVVDHGGYRGFNF